MHLRGAVWFYSVWGKKASFAFVELATKWNVLPNNFGTTWPCSFPLNKGRLLAWFLHVRWTLTPCRVWSSSPDPGRSRASKQYWPSGHPLTNIQWIAVRRNRFWARLFPLNNHRHGDREVKQSSNCQPRQRSKKRQREKEIRVYKQSGWNKFVFSKCQLPWPWLSVRSILFVLACTRAAAINFTECSEPLIRLANGACNLAESETHSTLNCR